MVGVAAPAPLRDWLGLPGMFVAASGTAALSAAVRALARRAGRRPGTVQVPALSCWTVTTAVRQAGAIPQYADVDGWLRPVRDQPSDAAIAVAPWGGPWPGAADPDTVLDASVALFAEADGPPPELAVISLGAGKPLQRPGGGGLLLFRDPEIARSIDFDLRHGQSNLAWLADGPRLRPGPAEDGLADRVGELAAELTERRERQRRAVDAVTAACPVLERLPESPAPPGISTVLPVLLAPGYPLPAEDVHRAAAAHGIPLAVQPVGPAYRQPAGRDLTGDCPEAERTARRLLFVPAEPLPPEQLAALAALLEQLAERPEEFAFPYGLTGSRQRLPGALRGAVTLARRTDRGFAAVDELTGRVYGISAEAAAALLGHWERQVAW